MEQGPEGWFSSPTKPASSTQTPRPPLKKKKRKKETINHPNGLFQAGSPLQLSGKQEMPPKVWNLFSGCALHAGSVAPASCCRQSGSRATPAPGPPALRVCGPWYHSCVPCPPESSLIITPAQHIGCLLAVAGMLHRIALQASWLHRN